MDPFHKNGVITGLLDSYCLPCEVYLGADSDIFAHIVDLRHKEKLNSTSYVEIHDNELIRKVPQGYFCEYCNKLFLTAVTVKLHVSDGEHRRNKDTQWLREQGEVVIVLNQLVVDSDSWHGLVDGVCALCNSEYLDREEHKSIPTHLLKLIQSTIELHTTGAIYRKGDDFFHCLICNAVFSLKSFGTHFEQVNHVKSYNKCCEFFKNLAAPMKINGPVTSNDLTSNNKNDYDLENMADVEDISDIKPIESERATETETNLFIKNEQQQNIQPQTTENTTLNKGNEELQTKKDCNNGMVNTNIEQVNEQERNKDKKNYSEVIVSESFQTQQKLGTLQEIMLKALLNKENDNDTLNDKEISGKQPIKKKQFCERETNMISENYSDVIAPKSFQIHVTLQEYEQQLLPVKDYANDAVNGKEISGQQSLSNEHVSEREANIISETYSKVIATESIQTQQITKALQEYEQDSLPVKEYTNDTVNKKEIAGQQFMNHEQTFERTAKEFNENHSNVAAEQSSQTAQTTDNSILNEIELKSLSKKEKAAIIAKANKIRHKEGYTRAFCSICGINIPSSLNNIKRHVNNVGHKNKAQQIFKYISNVIPTHKFVEELMFVELEAPVIDVIINNIYCVNLWSYLLMTNHYSYIRCHVCELNFNVGLFNDHRSSETHNDALRNVPVLCSLPSEFVREVQPGYYHCGFCNMYEGSWRGLKKHCNLQSHINQKSLAETKLECILSRPNK